jgi:predicted ATPase
MLIREIQLKNVLSFGPDTPPLPLRSLNVLIGANGSGKSNLLEAIALLRAAPTDVAACIREAGGIHDWLWKGAASPIATIDVVLTNPHGRVPLRHVLSLSESNQRFMLHDERVENAAAEAGETEPHFHYRFQQGRPIFKVKHSERKVPREGVNHEKSILAQRRDPEFFPEITYLAEQYARIRTYREWTFGPDAPARQPQKADQPNDHLLEDCSNLGLVLNRLCLDLILKRRFLAALSKLYAGIEDFHVLVEGGTVQVFFQEGKQSIPASRLSDGTLRYLSLLAVLFHPQPSPLVCIEEPELGLHPDAVSDVADLLVEASERMQLVVTTHSDVIVDALSRRPEDVIVCEKTEAQTVMRRLESAALTDWLEEYSLGQLWSRGQLGGNRW